MDLQFMSLVVILSACLETFEASQFSIHHLN